MFIYKIVVNNEIYIGFDTKESYKESRWKEHKRESKNKCRQLIHKRIKQYGIENCTYSIVEDNFTSYVELAKAEIQYIKHFNSFREGLNGTIGGDGFGGYNDVSVLSEEEIFDIKEALSKSMTHYNVHAKWANTTPLLRKEMTSHLHTNEVIEKRITSMKKTYKHNPMLAKAKGDALSKWRESNKEEFDRNSRINGLLGAKKMSKQIKVKHPDGTIIFYESKSDFNRRTGQWAKTLIDKTLNGQTHNGYQAWEI